MEGRRPANERSPTWDDKQKGVVTRALDVLEKEVKDLGKPNAKNTTSATSPSAAPSAISISASPPRTGGTAVRSWPPGTRPFAKRPSMAATVPKDQT